MKLTIGVDALVFSMTTNRAHRLLIELYWVSFPVQLLFMKSVTLDRINVFFNSRLFHSPPSSFFSKSSQSTSSVVEMTSFTLMS